jgi:threonylcarbamoyladenosine tRNA methylthiotransferase MtaB
MSSVQGLPRVAFKTLGCRLNQAESAAMAAQFRAAGYALVAYGDPWDVCVVHSCAVTAKAERTSVRQAHAARKARPDGVVVLAGCVAEFKGREALLAAGADLVAGQSDKQRLPELVAALRGHPAPAAMPKTLIPQFGTVRATVKVQDGCGFGCAYCVVPLVRGSPVSRPLSDIVDEVRKLAEAGHREVVLTGANLGCYRAGRHRLVDLVARIEGLGVVDRIRLSSIEPTTTERAIVDYMAGSRSLCRHLHIPLQSGDDGVLAAMGRTYTAAQYRAFVEYAAAKVPHIGLGTDLVAGFPGETEAAFNNTVAMVKDIPFGNLHVFPYSRRAGTRAAAMPSQVPEPVKARRTRLLIDLGAEKRRTFALGFVGHPVQVLVERRLRGTARAGWTSQYVEARVPSQTCRANDIVEFRPAKAQGGVLF